MRSLNARLCVLAEVKCANMRACMRRPVVKFRRDRIVLNFDILSKKGIYSRVHISSDEHTGLISSDSIQITTLTACITLKI